MLVKVECSCKTRYEFEVEPVNGRMPMPVQCPHCGANGTEAANQVIRSAISSLNPPPPPAAPGPSAPGVPVLNLPKPFSGAPHPPAPPPAPAPAAAARPASVPPVVPRQIRDTAMAEHCFKHAREPVAAFCVFCKKPICLLCMEKFGYFCSVRCRHGAEQRGMEIPIYEGQASVVAARREQNLRLAGFAVGAVVALILGLWVWYAFWGSKPSVYFSAKINPSGEVSECRFIGPEEVLYMDGEKMTVYDAAKRRERWSKNLAGYLTELKREPEPEEPEEELASPPADPNSPDAKKARLMRQLARMSESLQAGPQICVAGDELWVSFPARAVAFDRQSGQEKRSVPVPGTIDRIDAGDRAVFIYSRKGYFEKMVTRVDLASGEAKTETIRLLPDPVEAPPGAAVAEGGDPLQAELDAMLNAAETRGEDDEVAIPRIREWHAAGSNAALFEAKLLKESIVAVQAMKPPDEKAANPTSIKDTIGFANEVMNDMARQRGADVRHEDQSLYEVTMRRFFSSAPEWKGEVTGRPVLFPLRTIDVLIAGRTLIAFDKNNGKLWESTLAYRIDRAFLPEREMPGGVAVPCVEEGNTLYVFDQGVLSAFDTKTGEVRWRQPTVGIKKIGFDEKGMLYVIGTTAGPESIQFSGETGIGSEVRPLLMKVNPLSGKILWKQEMTKATGPIFLSGRFLYVSKEQVSNWDTLNTLAWNRGKEIPVHFWLYRYDSRNGKRLWEYHQDRGPLRVDFQGNRILLLFGDEIQVLKYLAL